MPQATRFLKVVGIEPYFVVRPSTDVYGENTFSIYLFDTASDGAGYATQANKDFGSLFKEARNILDCIKKCDTACHCCLLSYDTQYKKQYLDRHAALKILNDDFLLGLSLPHDLQVFGTATKLEVEPIQLALQRELRKRKNVTLIRLYLAGHPDLWEPLEWSLREDLLRVRSTGALIELVINKNDLNQFSSDLKNQLAALISVVGANAYVYESDVNSQTPYGILAINHEQGSTQWASSSRDALAPNSNWGSSAEENIFVIGLLDQAVSVVPDNWSKLLPSELQIVEANTIAISITSELNGSIQSFGDTAWELILEKAPELSSLLKGKQALTQISYSDRYLRSPETVVFLRAFMLGLKKIAVNFSVNSSFKINTCPIDLRNSNSPRFTEHDWRDAQDRKDVIEQIFQSGYGRFIFTEYKAYDLHHARVLNLAWDDGTQWEIRLDQGFGYWRSKTKETFPFERGVPKQSEVLSEMSFNVINASNLSTKIHPTFIYIVKR
jgi:DEAD/DEAH box helicase domain-containing protein